MIIDCISDLHGHYPKLEGGDLLIVAGDLTAGDTDIEHGKYIKWQYNLPYKKIIFIAGNHDDYIQKRSDLYIDGCDNDGKIAYLQDSGTEFEGLKIWGSPWTKWFHGVNPKCKAFMLSSEEKLAKKWALIPDDTDILITHSPLLGTFDLTSRNECVGSLSLAYRIAEIEAKLHVFGHIHECGGKISDGREIPKDIPGYYEVCRTVFVNASHVNERYEPVNKPTRVIL